jgi:hypothetical protein
LRKNPYVCKSGFELKLTLPQACDEREGGSGRLHFGSPTKDGFGEQEARETVRAAGAQVGSEGGIVCYRACDSRQ